MAKEICPFGVKYRLDKRLYILTNVLAWNKPTARPKVPHLHHSLKTLHDNTFGNAEAEIIAMGRVNVRIYLFGLLGVV